MNKAILVVCFFILILYGLVFGLLLTILKMFFHAILFIVVYHLSLLYIAVQFIENPKDVKK